MIEAAIFEAAGTSASPAAIWAVCMVVLVCLAFWLTAVTMASHGSATARRARAAPSRGSASRHEPAEGAGPARAAAGPLGEAVGIEPADEATEARRSGEAAETGPAGEATGTSPAGEAAETGTAGEAVAAAPAAPAGGTRVPPSGAVRILGDDEPWVPGPRTGEPGQPGQDEKPGHDERAAKTGQDEKTEKTERAAKAGPGERPR